MAHNIDNMMYVGAAPWHGLGKALAEPATSAEAIAAAGMDWEVELMPVYAHPQGLDAVKVPNKFATVRKDRVSALGVVGKNYTVVQNREAFGFFDSVVGEGKAVYEVAGSLGQGEQIWILAKLPGEMRVGKDDVVEKNLLLVNSHDGMSSLKMFFTPIRVVCQNTLSASLGMRKAGEGINLRHHANITDKVRQAQNALGIANKKYDELGQQFSHLASVKVNTQWLEDYVKLCFPAVDPEKTSTVLNNTRRRVMELVDSPSNTLVGSSGTAWGAYNAVTEFVDHARGGKSRQGDSRLRSIWMGSGAQLKESALNIAMELAK